MKGSLKVKEIKNAELYVLKNVQAEKSGEKQFDEVSQSLKVHISDGLFTVTGRTQETSSQPELVLLPRNHHLTVTCTEMS